MVCFEKINLEVKNPIVMNQCDNCSCIKKIFKFLNVREVSYGYIQTKIKSLKYF